MKYPLSALLLTLSTYAFANNSDAVFDTIRTVSNYDTSAQFSTIQTACNASSSGDSIYVSASPIVYADFTINNKKLAIFGPGWAPDKAYNARVTNCTVTGIKAAGSELHGLVFTSVLNVSSKVDSLVIIRNKFQTAASYVQINVSVNNYLFDGNWFSGSSIYCPNVITTSGFLIRNNIFYRNAETSVNGLRGSNIWFDHNLWYGPSSGSSDCFINCQSLTLSNNIFVRRNAANGNSGSTFQNNITYQTSNNTPWSSNGNIDGGGNVANASPQMVSQGSVNNGIDNPLLNFTISTGSANSSGTDGKDMGLMYDADINNWTRSKGPNLPVVVNMVLNNYSVPLGNNIQVTIDAKSN